MGIIIKTIMCIQGMKESLHSTSSIYMNMMAGYLSRVGSTDIQTIASDADITITERGRVPLDSMLALVNAIIATTRDRAFGLEMGIHIHPSEYGIISHAFMNCGSLREVMDLTIRYTHLINDAFSLAVEAQDKNEVTLVLHSTSHAPEIIPLIELNFASILSMARFLAGNKKAEEVTLFEVCFQHPPQTMPERYIAHFKCPVRFNQPQNAIRVSTRVLNTKVYSPDPYIYRYLLKKIEEVAERLQINIPLRNQVFNYVVKQLPYGMPSVSQAAKEFNMSPSTLKKHLNQEDANFTEICDAVRKSVAVKMISVHKKSLKEISNYLGFSNSSTFNRAFKRWTKMSPTQYRQRVNQKENTEQEQSKKLEEA